MLASLTFVTTRQCSSELGIVLAAPKVKMLNIKSKVSRVRGLCLFVWGEGIKMAFVFVENSAF